MWKILCSLSLLILSNFHNTQGYSLTADPQEETRGVGAFVSALFGKSCYCKCGVPNFNVDQYRSVNLKSLLNRNARSLIEGETEVVTDKITPATTTSLPITENSHNKDIVHTTENVGNGNSEAQEDDGEYIPVEIAKQDPGKLLGGDVYETNGFPWNVLILLQEANYIGGALISDKHIITAATPLYGLVPGNVKVIVGVHDRCIIEDGAWNASVHNITIHPSFDLNLRKHDIAILELNERLTFSKSVLPICLPEAHHNISSVQRVAWVASWLAPELPVAVPPIVNCLPKVIRVPTLSTDECNRANSIPGRVSFEKGCLEAYLSITQICQGDVGSAVQFINKHGQFELLGVLTDYNECESTVPTVYTRADQHITWIKDTIYNGCLCKI